MTQDIKDNINIAIDNLKAGNSNLFKDQMGDILNAKAAEVINLQKAEVGRNMIGDQLELDLEQDKVDEEV